METAQLIIVIVLVIIGIILFVVLLVELVNVPKALITPFTDGTTIKIKSLANNLYLKPVPCTSITSCNNSNVQTSCATTGQSIISAVGQQDDPETNWQLCQNSSLSNGTSSEAKYLIYSLGNQNTFIMTLIEGVLSLQQAPDVCIGLKSRTIRCDNTDAFTYFSFILNETSVGSTTSGSYNIVNACSNVYLATSGQGATSLPATICPPLVLTSAVQDFNCPNPQSDTRCSLSYLFEIEVQP